MGLWDRIYSSHRRKIRKKLIRRDGMVCGICQEPIESDADTTVDHIIPQADGGTHNLENLRLAHARRNVERGRGFFRRSGHQVSTSQEPTR